MAILSHGRCIVTGRTSDVLSAGTTGEVRVRLADLSAGATVLTAAGLTVTKADDALTVTGAADPADITKLLAAKKLYVSELTSVTADLEDGVPRSDGGRLMTSFARLCRSERNRLTARRLTRGLALVYVAVIVGLCIIAMATHTKHPGPGDKIWTARDTADAVQAMVGLGAGLASSSCQRRRCGVGAKNRASAAVLGDPPRAGHRSESGGAVGSRRSLRGCWASC